MIQCTMFVVVIQKEFSRGLPAGHYFPPPDITENKVCNHVLSH